jgi:glyoxylase-like metal-dependent hydrolase (beta-lactamase superfamily II)
MRKLFFAKTRLSTLTAAALSTLVLSNVAISAAHAATLQSAADLLKAKDIKTIEFSATGSWFQFGQAPAPTLAWPKFEVSGYSASFDYDKPAGHVQIVRKQALEAGRDRPAPVEQKPDQYVSGSYAWSVAAPANSAAGTAAVPNSQPVAVEERSAEIWSTPQGFVKAALANKAIEKSVKGGVEVSFKTNGKYSYVGIINERNQVESVKTWIDNPVLGDTLYETHFRDYQDFAGTQFPKHILRKLGGYPVLDINVSAVKANAPVDINVPVEVSGAKSPTVNVEVSTLANGVYYLRGGSHHSLAIDQKDHIVIVEAPLSEERSLAVIAKAKETIPNKPIKYLINTHAHFDHSGGLRTYVAEGATIVTHQDNKPYYQKVWAEPHTINPDRLASSKKKATFETFKDKHVLSDGSRKIEIYPIAGNSHNDAFALVYLPKEKILSEADAYTPLPPGATPPASVNPYSVNLYENIQKLKLEVDQIAGLHGPSAVKLADLKSYIGIKEVGINK